MRERGESETSASGPARRLLGWGIFDRPNGEFSTGVDIWSLHQGNPYIYRLRKGKTLRHDSDHGRWRAIEAYRAVDDCPILSIPAFPETVVQDRDGSGAGRLIGRRKIPPKNRPLTHQPECI